MNLAEAQAKLDARHPVCCPNCASEASRVENVDLYYRYYCEQCKNYIDIQVTYWAVFVNNEEADRQSLFPK